MMSIVIAPTLVPNWVIDSGPFGDLRVAIAFFPATRDSALVLLGSQLSINGQRMNWGAILVN